MLINAKLRIGKPRPLVFFYNHSINNCSKFYVFEINMRNINIAKKLISLLGNIRHGLTWHSLQHKPLPSISSKLYCDW